jgi:hypothetical protein
MTLAIDSARALTYTLVSTRRRHMEDMNMDEIKGFIASLLDFSFTDFVTPKILGILYGLVLASAAAGAITIVVLMFGRHVGLGVLALLTLGPLFFLVCVLGGRVMLELVTVVFRMKYTPADIDGTAPDDQ